jgi:tetratricopeptide (TPR) repeat protein
MYAITYGLAFAIMFNMGFQTWLFANGMLSPTIAGLGVYNLTYSSTDDLYELELDTTLFSDSTYQLTVGMPGGSNALAIAARLGLPGEIIDRARETMSRGAQQVEMMLADLNLKTGAFDPALEGAQEILKADPKSIQAHLILGNAYFSKRDIVRASREFEEVIRLAPSNPAGYYHLGRAFLVQRRDREAMAQFEKALAIQPNFLESLYFRRIRLSESKRE